MRKKSDKDIQKDIFRNLFGITIEQYEQILKLQNRKCAICKKCSNKNYGLIVDYNYKENKIRGLLCECCYGIICQIDDDPKLLEKAALYLREHLCTKQRSSSAPVSTVSR